MTEATEGCYRLYKILRWTLDGVIVVSLITELPVCVRLFLKGMHHFYDPSTSILVFLRSRVAQLYCCVDIRPMAIN